MEEESESEIVPPSAKSGARSAQSAMSARSAMNKGARKSGRVQSGGGGMKRSKRNVVEEVEENTNRPLGCGIQRKREKKKVIRKKGKKKHVVCMESRQKGIKEKPTVGKYIVFIDLCLSHLHRFYPLLLSLRRLHTPV